MAGRKGGPGSSVAVLIGAKPRSAPAAQIMFINSSSLTCDRSLVATEPECLSSTGASRLRLSQIGESNYAHHRIGTRLGRPVTRTLARPRIVLLICAKLYLN